MYNNKPDFINLDFKEFSLTEMEDRANAFFSLMNNRRTTRHFSKKRVSRELIKTAIKTASTAPSGAHLQPWTFVAVSNEDLKTRIREASEKEERRTYEDRMPESWSELLRPLGTDYIKEHISDAPWVIIVFRQTKRQRKNLEWSPTYYSQESCGIAIGLFIAAIHNMGLVTLTHTPSPMGFLREILGRPDHEHAMLLMPVGYPEDGAKVPNIARKDMAEVIKWKE